MNRAQAPALALLLAACAGLSGCGLNQAGVTPPSDTIAFPASAVLDRDSDWLFVTNSNADLRYNDGSLMAFSMTRAAKDREPYDPGTDPPRTENHPEWGDCSQVNYPNPRSDPKHFCCWDVVNRKRDALNCDERAYVGSNEDAQSETSEHGRGNVRIGSFAAGMVLQRATCPVDYKQGQAGRVACDATCGGYTSGRDRLLLGVRGDTSLTFVDVESRGPDTPPSLRCVGDPRIPEAPGHFASCDAQHRVIRAQSGLASVGNEPMPSDTPPAEVPLPDEPYALTIDDDAGLLFIGHLTGNTARAFSGGYSMFDIAPRTKDGPRTGYDQDPGLEAPRFIAPFSSPFAPNNLGAVGMSGLKTRKTIRTHEIAPGQTVRWEATVGVYATSRFVPQVAGLGTTTTCPLPMDATPVREIAAFPTGTYYSSPLTGAETRGVEFIDDRRSFVLQRTPPALIGFLDSTPTEVLETCGSPTFLDRNDNGVGPRLFVTCFADGEIYVFDPTVPRLVKTFRVGRGPAGLVFDRKRPVAYAVGFGDNNVSVIDLQPGSPTEYQVIQRIGFPRTLPR
jgi:hypothetical protein